MKVIDHLIHGKKPQVSFEIIPPERGRSGKIILEIVEQLKYFDPTFIDVTSHSAVANYEEQRNGTIKRRVRRKRPGTIGICGVIQNRFGIDTVAHLLCRGFTQEETEDALIELEFLGIENVFAIRGDDTNYHKPVDPHRHENVHANDLVRQIADLRSGKYVEEILNAEPMEFCVGVAGYPEKHFEAPNLKIDVQNLKRKVDAGAGYVVTQMFFDNQKYFNFVNDCRKNEINVPIIPGLKVIHRKNHIYSIPKKFFVDIPEELVDEMEANPEHASEIGFNWTLRQCRELLEAGENHLHFFVMNDAVVISKLLKELLK
ncbi:methylenetetrahydrofolate reductase [NAD(P)H] [candidate division KSB1 bacterium 4484_87]|nr:MAG: methylenetetrahydrofolate reductase [NAD(P)H] [candidate division KSB1 bacterium 4484_87]